MKKTFNFTVTATVDCETNYDDKVVHDWILSAIRDCALNGLIEDGIEVLDDACLDEITVEDADK